MKHPFVIFGGIGALLVVGVAVWAFFFLFYTPAPTPTSLAPNPFVEIGADESGFASATTQTEIDAAAVATPLSGALRQLTTRKVIGAVAAATTTVRFVEAGTGHIYEITDATEVKISNTTFAQARLAVWSPSGTRVAITRDAGEGSETFVGALTKNDGGESVLEGSILEGNPTNIAFGGAGETLFYTTPTPTGVTGISRNLKTGAEQTLFSTPLRDVVVTWEPSILMVTKASGELAGFAYTKNMGRVTESMPALTAKVVGGATVFSGRTGSTLTSWVQRGKDTIALSRGVLPEKCSFRGDNLLCAIPKNLEVETYPDAWYRGEVSYDDSLWLFDAMTGGGTEIADLRAANGDAVDVATVVTDQVGFLIINKNGGLTHYITAE